MKFDDSLGSRFENSFEGKKASTTENETISAQSAMDEYFDDMFGSVEEDPLKKLASKDDSLILTPESKQNSKSSNSNNTNEHLVPEPKRQLKQPTYDNLTSPQFDEPNLVNRNLSPLIIPAAFPKLAPIKTKTQSKAEPKIVTKSKLDSKTALTLLTKQKSKLSLAQKERLKEKLKSLSSVKQENKVSIKPTQLKPKAAEANNLEIKVSELITPEVLLVEPAAEALLKETESLRQSTNNKSEIETELAKNTLPDWASKRFECLLFSVAGLKLAVPLVSLGAIYKIEKGFSPLVGRASWFIGLYHHLERNVRVIDTAQWVMPERCSDEVRSGYKFIIRLGGNDWGLACDAVHESIQLSPDQIKWRSERTKREWLFGTVIDHMCALIDVSSLSSMLDQQASKNPSIFLN